MENEKEETEDAVEIYNSFVLPDDVLQIVFLYLPSQELVRNLRLVNKHFSFLITKNSNFLWRIMVERDLVKVLSPHSKHRHHSNSLHSSDEDTEEEDYENAQKIKENDKNIPEMDWYAVYKERFSKYYSWKYSLLVPQSNFDKLEHNPKKKKKILASAEAFFKMRQNSQENLAINSNNVNNPETKLSRAHLSKKKRKGNVFKRLIDKVKSEYIFFLMYLKLIYFMFFVQTPQPKYAPAVEINIVRKRAVEAGIWLISVLSFFPLIIGLLPLFATKSSTSDLINFFFVCLLFWAFLWTGRNGNVSKFFFFPHLEKMPKPNRTNNGNQQQNAQNPQIGNNQNINSIPNNTQNVIPNNRQQTTRRQKTNMYQALVLWLFLKLGNNSSRRNRNNATRTSNPRMLLLNPNNTQSLLTKKEFEKMCLVFLIGVITLLCNLQIDDLIIGCCVIVQLSVALGLSNSLNLMVGSKDIEWMVLSWDEEDGVKIAENLQQEISIRQQQLQNNNNTNNHAAVGQLQQNPIPGNQNNANIPQRNFLNTLLNTVGVRLLFRFFHRRSVLSCVVTMNIISMCLSLGGFEALLLLILCVYVALGGCNINGIAQLNSRYTNNIFVVFFSAVLGIFVYIISLGTLGKSFFSKNKIELKKELILLLRPLQEKVEKTIKEVCSSERAKEEKIWQKKTNGENEQETQKIKKRTQKCDSSFWDSYGMKLFAFGILFFSFAISIVRAGLLLFFPKLRIPLSSKFYKYYLP